MIGRLGPTLVAALVLAASGCRRAPPSGPTISATEDELAQLDVLAREDPERMACSIASLPSVIGIVPGTPRSRTRAVPDGTNRLARSVQLSMLSSQAMAVARRSGMSPTRAEEQVSRNVAKSRDAVAKAEGVGDDRKPGGPRASEESTLLWEYATLWATVVTEPETAGETEAKLAVLEAEAPWVVETYAGSLLYAYREWDLGC